MEVRPYHLWAYQPIASSADPVEPEWCPTPTPSTNKQFEGFAHQWCAKGLVMEPSQVEGKYLLKVSVLQ